MLRRVYTTLFDIALILVLSLFGVGGVWYIFTDTPPEQNTSSRETTTTTPAPSETYTNIYVVDGDTIHVTSSNGTKESIRLLGIDTPEINHETIEKSDCYALEAREILAELLKDTDAITLTQDPSQDTRDAYNRLLGYVSTSIHPDINKILIEFGAAKEYTYKGHAYMRQDMYKTAEAAAKENGLGLWSCE